MSDTTWDGMHRILNVAEEDAPAPLGTGLIDVREAHPLTAHERLPILPATPRADQTRSRTWRLADTSQISACRERDQLHALRPIPEARPPCQYARQAREDR